MIFKRSSSTPVRPVVLDIKEPVSRYQQPLPLSSPSILPFDIGTTIYNPKDGSAFQLIQPLGNGSYAVVYMVRERSTNMYYALKCLSKANLTDYQLDVQRNEVLIHERLMHPNIVKLERYFETPDWLFLVLEYCEGQDLYYWLTQSNDSRDPKTGKLLTEEERMVIIKQVFLQILEAVGYCHSRGVAHRDLKPENFIIMITDRGIQVKLTDFGLATDENESADFDCGSKPYMSYECRNPTHDTYDPRLADIWSLGVIFLNLIYHRSPWSDPNPEQCKSFATFNLDKSDFLIHRFMGMPEKVAHFLAKRVFCNAEEGRVSIKEWIYWCRNMVEKMFQVEDDDAIVPQPLPITSSSVPNKSSHDQNDYDRNDSWSEVFSEFDNEMDFTAPVLFTDKHLNNVSMDKSIAAASTTVASESVKAESNSDDVGPQEESKGDDEYTADVIANNSDADSGFGTDEEISANIMTGPCDSNSSKTPLSVSPPKVIYCKPKPWGEQKTRGHQRKSSLENGSNFTPNNSHWTSYNQRRERLEQRRKELQQPSSGANRRRGSYSVEEEASTSRYNMDYAQTRRQRPLHPSHLNHDKNLDNNTMQPAYKKELSPQKSQSPTQKLIYVPPMVNLSSQQKPPYNSTSQATSMKSSAGENAATPYRRVSSKSTEKTPKKVARSTKNHLSKMLAGVVMFNRGIKVGGQDFGSV
ncbi:4908_t:CDS:2 [Acaulospora morrowiae]|uniref:4908_t:CDS:1 n=1 Tax=Acaulospora morrowiae TaxID=94023 RepID=A0A9N9BET8_9GLOM|nr:4908_t:CDS:2 [Acaulospora morrowiae]